MYRIILFFSSVCGIGYIGLASGTFGSLAGLLLWKFFAPENTQTQILWVAGIIFLSIIFSSLAEEIHENKDDGRIVIDEVAGMWVTLLFLPKTWEFLLAGFILFRFFDIKKPLFINSLQKLRGGLGITIDDVAAGIFANLIIQGTLLILK